MSGTIGALNYRVGANVSGFVQGMTLSRSEMRTTRREMLASRTDSGKLQEKLDVLERAYKSGAIELEDYHRTMVRLKSETAEARAQRAQHAEDIRKAAQLTERLKTEEERLADERAELNRLKPHLSEQAYARALAEVQSKTAGAKGEADQLERTRARQQRREALLNREMEKGRSVTRSVENATEKYAREVRQLDKQLRRGTIGQETHRRAVERSTRELRQARMAQLSQVPALGRVTGALTSMNPALIAVTVGAAAFTVGFYAASRAAREFGREVIGQLSEIDDTAKMARRLGMMPQNLVALQLTSGELAGASVNVEMSMQRMTRRFAEAAAGGGEAKDAIKQLGLNAKELSGQDPAIIFQRVAEAIRKIENPAEQVRVAFKLFDSEGVGMVNVLREGGDVLERYQRLAESKGLSFTSEEGARVEAANDAIGRVKMTVEGLARTTGTELGPAISRIAKIAELGIPVMVAGLKEAARYYTNISSALGMGSSTAVFSGLAADPSNPTTTAADKEQAAIAAAIAAQESAASGINDQMESRLETLRKQNLELRVGADRAELILAFQNGATPAQLQQLRNLQRMNASLKEQETLRKSAQQQQETESRERKQKLDQIRNEGQQLTDSLRTPLEVLRANLQDYNRLLRAGAIDDRTAARARAGAMKEFAGGTNSEPQFAPTLRRGSDEAYKAIVSAMQKTPDNRIALMQEQIEIAREQASASEEMVRLLGNLQEPRGV